MAAGSASRSAADAPLGLGIAGLGMAGAVMVQAAAAHPGIKLCAAADPHPAPRDAFARDFGFLAVAPSGVSSAGADTSTGAAASTAAGARSAFGFAVLLGLLPSVRISVMRSSVNS